MKRKYKKRMSVQVSTPRVKKKMPPGNDYWLFMGLHTSSNPRVIALAKKPPKWKTETIRLGNIRYRKRPYKCQYDDCIFP